MARLTVLAILPFLAFLHLNVLASHELAVRTFGRKGQAFVRQFGTHDRIIVDANGGAAFYDAAFADETRGFLFGQEFFEGLVVEFLGMGGIFACKRWFNRERGLAGELWGAHNAK